ncbi:unnamed protein product [Cuscuta epithymum]|uniref:Elongation factor Ts, mitochondrial n=1 Tax=Cuscuta epithymum TaxID=186058 RepID=A0AAV0G731_9ASTE|nr:unnamed protein product [Cuscuta epithymum]
MAPAIPTTINCTSLSPGNIFIGRKNCLLTRCSNFQKSDSQTLFAQRYAITFSASHRLFPHFGLSVDANPKSNSIVSSAKTDVIVEEAQSPTVGNIYMEAAETSTDIGTQRKESTIKSNSNPTLAPSKRSKFSRKSEMPPVKNEDLTPGAILTGKVRSVQPFGAFVDIGAFTDGLVHVSNLSNTFVKDVGSFVSVGQEVKVRLVDVDMESGRISLTMRENDGPSKPNQPKNPPVKNDKSRTPKRAPQTSNQRREEVKKTSKFVLAQDLEGTVKNLTRSGAFISLPEGEEGFLPKSELDDGGFGDIMGGSSLEVGQKVNVRVLRITRAQVTLTTKKEAAGEFDEKLQGVIHTATNPFALAFRKNEDISKFLDQREEEMLAEMSEKDHNKAESGASMVGGSLYGTSSDALDAKDSTTTRDQQNEEPSAVKDEKLPKISAKDEEIVASMEEENDVNINLIHEEVNGASQSIIIEEVDASSETLEEARASTTTTDDPSEEPSATDDMSFPKTTMSWLSEEPSALNASESTAEPDMSQQIMDKSFSAESSEEVLRNEEVHNVKGEAQTQKAVSKVLLHTQGEEEPSGSNFHENSSTVSISEQNIVSQNRKNMTEAAISPALVKQLRAETIAGMMDCKNALSATDGDIVKAVEYLRKKGLVSADKKASRTTAEGRIDSYIHDSRIGVLIEVNCETDFASRGDIFRELVDDLAMQIAACPQVQYLSTEDVPEDIANKEREIEMQKEDLMSKPEQIRSKIVDGRIRKRLGEFALLEQPYIKNDKVMVKDWVKQAVATIGENINVKRFVRYNLGEGLEKKNQNFAAEVAAQTAVKSVSPPDKEQLAVSKDDGTVEAPRKSVSAALVKQLREQTGAGMMDCKKALSETGGDLEKAQEYLRKKGLSSADKKSSRLAAEGRIGSYIHDSRIGVLIEVNCETDFVGRSERFKELVDNLAMQAVACPQVQYVNVEDIPESVVKKEKELESEREDLEDKAESIREKIVEGRVAKRLSELSLMEQTFIKDDSMLVKDLVKQTIAALGENIKVRRFVRFTLGDE